jgi:hypothetical protein
MKKILMLATLALVLSGGAAFADHWRGGWRGGAAYSRPVYSHPVYRGSYGGYYGGYVARRPMYVRSPIIREHYYNYYRRPALIVENYGPMEGYVWVRGGWTWNGYEWIWAPGHYQPVY